MVRVGVLGYGYWGPNLVRVFQECEGSRVVCVCDRDASRLNQVSRRYPSIHCCTDAGELFHDDEVNLVVVATPLDSHFDLAKRAITTGKHVLVEKPFTRTSVHAEELIDLAARRGVVLAVDHTFVYTPAVEKMKELIGQQHLGRLNYVDSVRINLGLIREEIDVVWDLAPHDLSILDYLLERVPRRVVTTGACHHGSKQVDVAYINLDYGEGLIANIHVNWLSPVKIRRMIFGGDRRMIIFDDLSNNEKVRVYNSGTNAGPIQVNGKGPSAARVDYRIGDIWTPHLPPREALAAEAEHMVDAIEHGKPLRADGCAGLRVVQILEACEKSLRLDGERIATRVTPLSRPACRLSRSDHPAEECEPRLAVALSKPVLGDPEIAAVGEVLRSGWVTQGPVTQQFETAVARYVGARHGVAVSNGTAALHLALKVLDVGPGDEVIVPSFTFVATANVVRYSGATPVFADVGADTFNLDPVAVEGAVTPRTKVILAVHQFGLPADLDRLHAIARKHRCVVVEDAACALGSVYKERRIGTHSALVCFSFHPRKVITTGEGGMIMTDSEKFAQRLRRLRHHGMNQTDWQRHQETFPVRESYVEVGFNYRMSDLCAAVGLAQMNRLEGLLQSRRRLVESYDEVLRRHPGLRVGMCPFDAESNGQTYAVVVSEHSSLDRDSLVAGLRRQGIAAKLGPACIHREPCYAADRQAGLPARTDCSARTDGSARTDRSVRTESSARITKLTNSEALAERMLLLPLHPDMTGPEQEHVLKTLLDLLACPSKPACHQQAGLPARSVALGDLKYPAIVSVLEPAGRLESAVPSRGLVPPVSETVAAGTWGSS